MKKHFFKQIILFAIIAFLLSGSALFLLKTNQGLRFCLMVAAKITHGKLTAEKIDGNLIGPIDIEKGYFANKEASVFVGKLHLEWKIQDLLSGKINILSIYADNLKISTSTSAVKKRNLTIKEIMANLRKLYLPTCIKLENLQLYNILWQQGSSAPIKIAKIVMQLRATKGNFDAIKIELQAQNSSVLVNGTLQKEWAINWNINLPNLNNVFRGAEGSLMSKGNVYGERDSPKIDAVVNIGQFKYSNIACASFAGKTHVDLSVAKKSQLELNIGALKINNFVFDHLAISAGMGRETPNTQDIVFNANIGAVTMFFHVGDSVQSLKLNKGNILGNLGRRGFSLKSTLFFEQYDPINIELKLPKLNNIDSLYYEQPLNGLVTWQTKNLSFLQTVLPNIKNVQGILKAKYTIGGTLQDPAFVGDVSLSKASLQIPELNIKVENIKLNIRGVYNKIEYDCVAHSGSGVLNLSGETILAQNKFNSRLAVNSVDFLIANTQEYNVVVSSQLVLQTKGNVLILTGKILVPKALIKPSGLNGNDALPSEIVYVEKEKNDKYKGLDLYAKIKLVLGDDVSIDIMGLKGKVQGQLQISDEPRKITTALGSLYINDGNYHIYGQQLKVIKGNLHFFGGAVTNPEITVEAIREFKASNHSFSFGSSGGALIVGIRMYGMLDNTKIDLFSVPDGLAKQEVLSYLIMGKSSDQVSGNSAQLLLQAATALNFGGAGDISNFIDNLRKKIGFSEFGLDEETRLNTPKDITSSRLNFSDKPGSVLTTNTVFVLGKFLTPKIFVGYSMSLLDANNILRVKYYINKYWSIQSESSNLGNGVDLFYTIERN